MDKSKACVGHSYLHYRYAILIIVIVSILSFSYWYSGESKLVEVFGFAATVTSLFLGALAIIYSMVESGRTDNTLFKISEAADVTKNSVLKAEQSIGEFNKALNSLTDDLLKKVDGISLDVEGRVKNIFAHQSLDTFEKHENKEDPNLKRNVNSNDLARQFLGPSSSFGLKVILKSFVLAYDSKRSVDAGKLSEIIGGGEVEFTNVAKGYTIATAAILENLGLISISENIELFEIKTLEESLRNAANESFEELRKRELEKDSKREDFEKIEAGLAAMFLTKV